MLPSIQLELSNTETNNTDIKNKVIDKLNTDNKTKNHVKKKSKKLSKKESSEKSSEEESPIKDDDESSKHTKISESEYDPTKKNYHPIRDAFWDHNQP